MIKLKLSIDIARFFTIVIPVVVVGYVLWCNIAPTGEVTAHTTASSTSSIIAEWRPADNAQRRACDADGCYRRIIRDMQEFEVWQSRRFLTVEVILTYRNPEGLPLQLGVRKRGTGDPIKPQALTGSSDARGWEQATATFDISTLFDKKQRQLEFVLSAPGLEASGGQIQIRDIDFTFHGAALSAGKIFSVIRNFLP